jgi:hypothetical protein
MVERKRIEEIAAEHGLSEDEIDTSIDGLIKWCKRSGFDPHLDK